MQSYKELLQQLISNFPNLDLVNLAFWHWKKDVKHKIINVQTTKGRQTNSSKVVCNAVGGPILCKTQQNQVQNSSKLQKSSKTPL